VYQPLSGVT